jgi:hypothetical protein
MPLYIICLSIIFHQYYAFKDDKIIIIDWLMQSQITKRVDKRMCNWSVNLHVSLEKPNELILVNKNV